jgi:hypothetical protein
MKKINQVGKVISRSEMKKVIGGWDPAIYGPNAIYWGIDSPYDYAQDQRAKCDVINFNMKNHSYVLNPDGTDFWREEWKKNNCDNFGPVD